MYVCMYVCMYIYIKKSIDLCNQPISRQTCAPSASLDTAALSSTLPMQAVLGRGRDSFARPTNNTE